MDNREALKSMLNNLINDKGEEAQLDFHTYATNKMREIAGLAPTVAAPAEAEVATDVPADEAPAGEDAAE